MIVLANPQLKNLRLWRKSLIKEGNRDSNSRGVCTSNAGLISFSGKNTKGI